MFKARLNDSEPPSAAACEALMRLVTVMSRSYINTDVDKSRGGETQYMEDVWGELRQFLQNNVQNRNLVRTLGPSLLPEVSLCDALYLESNLDLLLAEWPLCPESIWICSWLSGLTKCLHHWIRS